MLECVFDNTHCIGERRAKCQPKVSLLPLPPERIRSASTTIWSAPSIRSIRGARSRNGASMRVCHRSGGSNTWESDERTRGERTSGSVGISFLTWSRAAPLATGPSPSRWVPLVIRARLPSRSAWGPPGPSGAGRCLDALYRDGAEPRHQQRGYLDGVGALAMAWFAADIIAIFASRSRSIIGVRMAEVGSRHGWSGARPRGPPALPAHSLRAAISLPAETAAPLRFLLVKDLIGNALW